MSANLNLVEGGLTVTDGTQTFNVASTVITGFGSDGMPLEQWHKKGAEGARLNVREAWGQINNKGQYDTFIVPMWNHHDGQRVPSEWGMICRRDTDGGFPIPISSEPVRIGKMTDSDWAMLNPDAINGEWQISYVHEHVSYNNLVEMYSKHVRDVDGNHPDIAGMSLLGKDGNGGLAITAHLPQWSDRTADLLGTSAMQYFTAFVHPTEPLAVYTSQIVVVCANTLASGMSQAEINNALMRVTHKGARKGDESHTTASESLERHMQRIYGAALMASQMDEKFYLALAQSKITPDDFAQILGVVYRNPNVPDPNTDYKSSYADRMDAYEKRMREVMLRREALMEVFEDSRWYDAAGVTDEIRGTGMAALQVISFHETHRSARNIRVKERQLQGNGERIGSIRSASKSLYQIISERGDSVFA